MTEKQIKKKLKLDYIALFREDRAIVRKNDKYGHVDRNGKVTTPIIYDHVDQFYEGRAIVKKNNKWGHIGLDGNII